MCLLCCLLCNYFWIGFTLHVQDPKPLDVYGADFVIDGPQLGFLGKANCSKHHTHECYFVNHCKTNMLSQLSRILVQMFHHFCLYTAAHTSSCKIVIISKRSLISLSQLLPSYSIERSPFTVVVHFAVSDVDQNLLLLTYQPEGDYIMPFQTCLSPLFHEHFLRISFLFS